METTEARRMASTDVVETDAGHQQETTTLLADLAEALHWAAVPSDSVERRVVDAGKGLAIEAQAFVLQGYLTVETQVGERKCVEHRRAPADTHFDLRRLHSLIHLSRMLTRGECSVAQGRDRLEHIRSQRPLYPKALVVLGYGIYGAAVAARVGGGVMESIVAAMIGLLAGFIHYVAARSMRVDLQQSFIAALVGTLAALGLMLVLPSFNAAQAVFGGMCLMVPAMVLTIGVHELANDAIESGSVRVAYGVLRFAMVGFGIIAAAKLWALAAPLPPRVISTPFSWPVALALAIIGGAALTLVLQGRARDLPWIVAGAFIAYGAHKLTILLFGGKGSLFVAALVLGIAAGLQARLPGHNAGTMVIPGLLQLAPGYLGTQDILGMLGRGDHPDSAAPFVNVILSALQLVSGLLVASVLVGLLGETKARRARARAKDRPRPAPALRPAES
jgi:uncharacterized membrane protein YjjP (DUF1212 family)/uncharacterized membrane protein YjjB (DUF3815 family)